MALSKIKSSSIADTAIHGRRNLIINGAMQVSQRHGTSVYSQVNSGFNLDRFKGNSYDGGAATGKFTVQQSSTVPNDFSHSLLVTSLAATADNANNIFNIEQLIEGYNTAHLNYGSSSAKTITLSFYVRSSLTGTFGGALKNNDRNRAYPFSYTINSADTFERKEITIAGDTSGTWVGSTNGMGLWVSFGLGVGSTRSGTAGAWGGGDMFSSTGATSVVGTSGATWYITGVQLEVGEQATPFEHRSYGEELALCERYFQKHFGTTDASYYTAYAGLKWSLNTLFISFPLRQIMRAEPSASILNKDGSAKSNVVGNAAGNNNNDNFTAGNMTLQIGHDGVAMFTIGLDYNPDINYTYNAFIDNSTRIDFDAEL